MEMESVLREFVSAIQAGLVMLATLALVLAIARSTDSATTVCAIAKMGSTAEIVPSPASLSRANAQCSACEDACNTVKQFMQPKVPLPPTNAMANAPSAVCRFVWRGKIQCC